MYIIIYETDLQPVQVRCVTQGAQGWCTGMTQRDGMGREVGGGSGWGTHVHPWLIHVNVWQKPVQYCKVISLQLKKKKESICQCKRRRKHGFNSWIREDPLEKGMATHSNILVWEIPWTEEPGGLQSTGSQRVGHD